MVKRYDLVPDVYELLSEITDFQLVAPTFPDELTVLPAAIYNTTARPHTQDLQNNELHTAWTIDIDLYGDKHQDLGGLIQQTMDKFTGYGLKSVETRDANTANMSGTRLSFTGIVDNQNLFIYH